MIRRMIFAAAAAAALLMPAMASAQIYKQFSRKDLTVQLDPGLSYIFYRTQVQVPMIFIRQPDQADFDAWRQGREATLEKAMKKYRRQYRTYESDQKSWDRAAPQMRKGMTRPVKPVMPTLDTLPFPTIEQTTMTQGSISPAFFKEKPIFGFLIAVKPGTYSIYGSVMLLGTGYGGVCMCMGTLKFDARPGEVIDLGIFAIQGVAVGARPPRVPLYGHPLPTELRPFDGPLPARLQGLPVRSAEFRAAGKLPNYFGVTIDRMAPMPGVLGYRRDTIIDGRDGQPLKRQTETVDFD